MISRLNQRTLPEPEAPPRRGQDIEEVQNALLGIRFGEVRVVIQDGVIVQIDRMEKLRVR